MAKLHFYYSTMNAGKSLEALKIAHSFESQGRKVIAMIPSVDTRYGVGKITSRVGMSRDAMVISPARNIIQMIQELEDDGNSIFCLIIDEAQFLNKEQIYQLSYISREMDISVFCFGLRTHFKGELFEGSAALMTLADKIREIKSSCGIANCPRKGTMVVRLTDGEPVYEGPIIKIGGNDEYMQVCSKHYFDFPKEWKR